MRPPSVTQMGKLSLGLIAVGVILIMSPMFSPSAHASNQTVTMNLSYTIVGPNAVAPNFIYFYQGSQQTVVLTTTPKNYVVDAGTPWSATTELQGSNNTVRWATQESGGTTANATLALVYYYQYRVDFNYSVVEGGTGPITVTGATEWGGQASLNAGSVAWVDAGSAFSYPSLVQPGSGERWTSDGLSGVISKPSNFTVQYFHQYFVIARYSAAESGSPSSPTLSGVSFNTTVRQTLTATNSSRWLDAGTTYQATDPLQGSNSSSRWYALGGQGVVSSPTYISLVYYHQYSVTGSYTVVDGNSPAAPQLLSKFFGNKGGQYLTESPAVYWVDAGSSYSVPTSLQGSSITERWMMNGGLTGVVTSSLSFHAVYYHQYPISLTYQPPQGTAPTPELDFTSFGAPVAVSLNPGIVNRWGDNGTSIAVGVNETLLARGERWTAGPAIPSTLSSQLNDTVTLYHQFEVSLSYSISGGGAPEPPTLTGTSQGRPMRVNLTAGVTQYWLDAGAPWSVPSILSGSQNQERWFTIQETGGNLTGAFSAQLVFVHQYHLTVEANPNTSAASPSSGWYDANSTVQLSETPGQGLIFKGWQGNGTGAYKGENASVSIIFTGPLSEIASFGPGSFVLQITTGRGGSVTYSYGNTQGSLQAGGFTQVSAPPGTTITLVANPSSFLFSFTGWSGSAVSTNEKLALQMGSNSALAANFGLNDAAVAGLAVLWAAIVIGGAILLKNRRRLLTLFRRTSSGGDRGRE